MRSLLVPTYKFLKAKFGGRGLDKLPAVKWLNAYALRKLSVQQTVQIDGHTIELDEHDSLNLSVFGTFEKFEADLLRQEIRAGDVIIDIGANIGYYTLIFARAVGKTGKVYAFEPDPKNFALLKRNVERNGYTNVVLINKAVSNNTDPLKLFLSDNNMGDHRTWDSREGRPFVEVDSVILDHYFAERETEINFIKMDIQGFEYTAIEGMANLLKSNQRLKLVTELWPMGLKQAGSSAQAVLEFLWEAGFEIYQVDERRQILRPVEKDLAILKEFPEDKDIFTNLFCRKESPPFS